MGVGRVTRLSEDRHGREGEGEGIQTGGRDLGGGEAGEKGGLKGEGGREGGTA